MIAAVIIAQAYGLAIAVAVGDAVIVWAQHPRRPIQRIVSARQPVTAPMGRNPSPHRRHAHTHAPSHRTDKAPTPVLRWPRDN